MLLNIRVFNARFVNKIKNENTKKHIKNYVWFFIYHKYYTKHFVLIELIYDSCLFHCIELFVAINFQIDNILVFVNNDFA